MSSPLEHIALANRSQATLEHLLSDVARNSEWIATTAFYKALHVAHAIFALENPPAHYGNHSDALDSLKRNRNYSPLFPHYRVLWNASLIARYLAHDAGNPQQRQAFSCFEDYLPAAAIQALLLDQCLVRFEHLAVQLLGSLAANLNRHAHSSPVSPTSPSVP